MKMKFVWYEIKWYKINWYNKVRLRVKMLIVSWKKKLLEKYWGFLDVII